MAEYCKNQPYEINNGDGWKYRKCRRIVASKSDFCKKKLWFEVYDGSMDHYFCFISISEAFSTNQINKSKDGC